MCNWFLYVAGNGTKRIPYQCLLFFSEKLHSAVPEQFTAARKTFIKSCSTLKVFVFGQFQSSTDFQLCL